MAGRQVKTRLRTSRSKATRAPSNGRAPVAKLPEARLIFFKHLDFFDYHRAPTEAAIRKAERKLGVRLPKSYIELIRQQNGGDLRWTGTKPPQRPPRWFTQRPVYNLRMIPGVHPDFGSLSWVTITARVGWDIPPETVALDGEPGRWWVCLDYRTGGPAGEPCITHFDVPSERSFKVASSFAQLLRSLRFDAGSQIVFAMDEPGNSEHSLRSSMRRTGARLRPRRGKQSQTMPLAWRWSKYRGVNRNPAAGVMLAENGDHDAWHLARPAGHPLLLLSVDAVDQDRAVCDLLSEFGRMLSLIHVPMDRPRVRGVPVGQGPARSSRRRNRGSSSKPAP